MLGLGLGIDYGLLVVSRFREERGARPRRGRRGRGGPWPPPAARSCSRRSRWRSRSPRCWCSTTRRSARSRLAGIGVVLAALLSAHTLLPVLLQRFGHRLRPSPSPPVRPRLRSPAWPGVIQRRAVAGGAGGRCAARAPRPALPRRPLRRHRGEGAPEVVRDAAGRRGHRRALHRRSPPSRSTSSPDVDPDDPALAGWLADVERLPGVRGVAGERPLAAPGRPSWRSQPEGATNGPTAQAVVRSVRALEPGFEVPVGGDPAEIVDFRAAPLGSPAAGHRAARRGDVRAAVPDDRLGGGAR